MNKKSMSEQDIRTNFITPNLQAAGWKGWRMREEVFFTDGRMIVRGQMGMRGKRKRADYILYHKPNQPLAIVEAKDNKHPLGGGMQQALDYAKILDIPFVYSSNGDAFLEHDRTKTGGPLEREIPLDRFPTPEELWQRYKAAQQITPTTEPVVTQDYHTERGGKTPRYYQRIAINRTVEAIAQEQDRILLVMATGTGKTFVAAQIIWRLWKAGVKKRILFLADRNILVDQARLNDFKHFGGVMTKVTNREVDKSYELYLALYQAVSGSEDWKNIYKEFSPGFFDLIVVDECHRGSAAAESAWREIFEYFSSATQIGLTATPKETKEVSNIDYFGEPLYTYSLKQGIEDGFLAPYKVIRVNLDIDQGWTPDEGQLDKYGHEIPEQEYNLSDFDRNIVIDERTEQVARRISDFLKDTNRNDKTIVFCRDIEHAERMRQALINENGDLYSQDERYIMRITGDSAEGKLELDNFINPEEKYPVIVTTSKLLTTGVDAQTCKLIVLDTIINSMTEFKQIIGRGSRLREDFDKRFFTIIDFRGATRLFRDDAFDGPPIQIYEPDEDDPIVPPDPGSNQTSEVSETSEVSTSSAPGPYPKLYVQGVAVDVLAERVQYYGADGKLVLESFKEFSRNNLRRIYHSLDEFLNQWQAAERKEVVMAELLEQGVLLDKLEEEYGAETDPFDLICHVAFDRPPLTRRERANNVQKRDIFGQYGDTARAVLTAMLDKYAKEGVESLEEAIEEDKLAPVLKLPPFNQIDSPVQIIRAFGSKEGYIAAVKQLEQEIYQAA